ncbi:hypothetical protein RHSIM_Rhsim04G0127800 [Rhododendron simsii]|uniref:Uncharacterized protein n=1 Tax=Rhododendron simsii TaxID=118357 RepID=A0A834LPF9_RHOSS|nr:hypothetical protein RHSIM_Rhsim04G0127800 [Rhododendron simsii]
MVAPLCKIQPVLMRLSTRDRWLRPLESFRADARLVRAVEEGVYRGGEVRVPLFDRGGTRTGPSEVGQDILGLLVTVLLQRLTSPRDCTPAGQASEFHGKNVRFRSPSGWFTLILRASMGRYDMVSVVHTQFLMAFCFEHFRESRAPHADISEGEEPRPRIMRWSGVSSTKPWGKRIDDADAFFPRPYASPSKVRFPLASFQRMTVLGVLLLWCFRRNDRATSFTVPTAAWRRNLTLQNYVRGVPEIRLFQKSTIATRHHHRGPLSTVIPPRLTRDEGEGKTALQEQGPQLKRIRKIRRWPEFTVCAAPSSLVSASRFAGGQSSLLPRILAGLKREIWANKNSGQTSGDELFMFQMQLFRLSYSSSPAKNSSAVAASTKTPDHRLSDVVAASSLIHELFHELF